MRINFPSSILTAATLCLAWSLAGSYGACAQSSSSSNRGAQKEKREQEPDAAKDSSSTKRGQQAEAAGAAITLDTNEALFEMAAGLNACGYDDDLKNSNPVRLRIRQQISSNVQASPAAVKSQAALCDYINGHQLSDRGRQLAQYVSLALFLTPPPALTPAVDQTEMPPDALQVVNVLPLLRQFAEDASLHTVWLAHRAEYSAIVDKVHDPLTRMILNTNIYLHLPVSSYDGRRFLILVEPMLAPSAPNARIYASEYALVTSPAADSAIRMEQVRHLYLHFEIEPLVYARAASMQRLTPLLKPVAEAPLEFVYKSDIVALLTECLIKAIEARTMDVGIPKPAKPVGTRARVDLALYDSQIAAYERDAEVVRRKQVLLDMRQGWVLTEYFYGQMTGMERDQIGLGDRMGEMVYGMDVDRERHHDEQIEFLPEGSSEFVRRAPRVPTGMMLAEKLMLEGKVNDAEVLAEKALADPKQDHAAAQYVLARIDLMKNEPELSMDGFNDVLKTSKDPHTIAWAHVYRGRLYDTHEPAQRKLATEEYKAALATPGVQPDARSAAEQGLKAAFKIPRTEHVQEQPFDPSGKAEKDAYRPEDEEAPAPASAPSVKAPQTLPVHPR